MSENDKNFFSVHLQELRSRIVKCFIFLILSAFSCFYFSSYILEILIRPIEKVVFIYPAEAFAANLSLSFWLGLIISSPVFIYHLWCFAASGLREREKKYVIFFTFASFFLFLIGVAAGYFVILPFGLKFFLGFASDNIEPMLSLKSYITFIAGLVLTFGLVFQLPLVMIFLTKLGIVDHDLLSRHRREAIVIIFIIAAFFTPPDVATQCFLAFPLLFLYELSVLFSKLVYNRRRGQGG